MIKYILPLILISNTYAESINKYECTLNSQLNDCLTPQQFKMVVDEYNRQQLLPKVEIEQYVEKPFKYEKTVLHSSNSRCTMSVNLLERCPSAEQLKIAKLLNEYKNRRIKNVSTIKTKSKSNHLQ